LQDGEKGNLPWVILSVLLLGLGIALGWYFGIEKPAETARLADMAREAASAKEKQTEAETAQMAKVFSQAGGSTNEKQFDSDYAQVQKNILEAEATKGKTAEPKKLNVVISQNKIHLGEAFTLTVTVEGDYTAAIQFPDNIPGLDQVSSVPGSSISVTNDIMHTQTSLALVFIARTAGNIVVPQTTATASDGQKLTFEPFQITVIP
jgi:hypothetical protein